VKIMNSPVVATALITFSLSVGNVYAVETDPEDTENTRVTFNDLFRARNVHSIELSPTAEFIAYRRGQEIWVGNADVSYRRIHRFYDYVVVQGIYWIGNDSLVVLIWNGNTGKSILHSTRMGPDKNGGYVEISQKYYTVDGYIEDVLLEDPNEIIFARMRRDDESVAVDLFRINVFADPLGIFKRSQAISTGSKDYYSYVRDSAYNYVVGIRYNDGVPEIWRRSVGGDDWTRLWVATKESELNPFSISADGRSLFALSNAFTDKTAAVEIDLQEGTLVRTIYEHERFDLDTLLIDDNSEPFGAIYTEQGIYRYHFFADDARKEFQRVQAKFPDKGIIIVGRSSDGNVQLVKTSTSKDRGQIQRCDLSSDECEMLVSLAPWLDDAELSDTVVLDIDSKVGVTVDAFLTLPVDGGESLPLIAMPHGGPIGVSDSRYFSEHVQWLAHNGYAVLQVNYRGSSGYGKEFESAGLREWGRGIEDDIDAAVLTALDRYPQLDRGRVGIFGASYGGYSALMSVIRNPDLYQCGASFAGVTDLTLLFSQSRMHRNPELREKMTRIIGDPDLDYEEQRANSPVYRYKEIQRPILLAHGTKDRVVDVEHSWRLRMLMRLTGVEPEFVILDDVGHGFTLIKEAKSLYDPLLVFLDKHLMPEADISSEL
jgi:dipeptidyl aminopeptidase/acylaminoacyl peptidase